MPKRDLADRLCAAIEVLTARRASRSHGFQFVMAHTVARHMGITDEQADQAVAEAPWRNAVSSATAATRRIAWRCFLACAKATSSNPPAPASCKQPGADRPGWFQLHRRPQPAGDNGKIARLDQRRGRNADD